MSIYDYSVPTPDGGQFNLSDNKGKVMVIVNTATGCGFTPHYEPLEAMYEKYHDKGLEIIDVPCNQFMGQAPGTDEEIHEFCTLHYKYKIPSDEKSDCKWRESAATLCLPEEPAGLQGIWRRRSC